MLDGDHGRPITALLEPTPNLRAHESVVPVFCPILGHVGLLGAVLLVRVRGHRPINKANTLLLEASWVPTTIVIGGLASIPASAGAKRKMGCVRRVAQEWRLRTVSDHAFCHRCDIETRLDDVPIIASGQADRP